MLAAKKLLLPGSGMAIHASNKFKHPGNALKNQLVLTQKTHEDEENKCQEDAEKCMEIQSAHKAAVAVIASLEDDLVSQDMQHEQAHIEGYKSNGANKSAKTTAKNLGQVESSKTPVGGDKTVPQSQL
ncbi:hypothetical protein APHAL10511_001389 [Amanita phalloides]|nr:hypothetical protein APHAL10511_001389 [Amanita phalloides]